MALNISISHTASDLDALAKPWQGLEKQVPHALPFQTWAWNSAWWATFAVNTHWRRDVLYVVSFFDGSKLVAVLPLVISKFGLAGFGLFHYVRPFGADANLTEIRSPLILPGHEAQVVKYWLDLIHSQGLRTAMYQIIAPAQVLQEQATLTPGAHLVNRRHIRNYVVELTADWDSFRAGLKRNIKESVRRCYNSLAREELTCALEVLTEPAQVHAHLGQFFNLHSGRSKQQTGTQHPDYFASSAHREFVKRMIDSTSGSAQPAHLFCLRVNGSIVAMRFGFLVNDELYLYYSGYDLTHAKYSVMTTLVVEVMRWSMAKGILRINFSVGQDVSKTRWSPIEIGYTESEFVKTGFPNQTLSKLTLWIKKFKYSKMNRLALQTPDSGKSDET